MPAYECWICETEFTLTYDLPPFSDIHCNACKKIISIEKRLQEIEEKIARLEDNSE